jgi:serine/threonine protein kinase
VVGNCEWITQNVSYRAWLNSDGDGDGSNKDNMRPLWISGGPGKGKTIMSVFLTEELEKHTARADNAELVFFFCSAQDEKRNTAVAVLRGLVHQIITKRPRLVKHALPYFDTPERTHQTLSSLEALWLILRKLVADAELGTMFCVLDGPDECEESTLRVLLLRIVSLLTSEAPSTRGILKLAIVSRELPGLRGCMRVKLDTDNDEKVLLAGPIEALAAACGWQPDGPKFLWELEAGTPLVETDRRLLGRGTVGEVHEVRVPGFRETMARKRIFLPKSKKQAQRDRVRIVTEVANLRSLNHPHIVKILGCYEEATGERSLAFCALMYPAADDDLTHFLYEDCQQVSELQKQWINTWFGCLASALVYMHSNGIHHEDIKPNNIVHHGSKIFFTDFSSSRRLEAGQETSTDSPAMASRLFAAPEVMSDDGSVQRHGSKTDVYSLGLVFVEMLAVSLGADIEQMRDSLFGEERQNMRYSRVVDEIASVLSNFTLTKSTPLLWDRCLNGMLNPDRQARPSAETVLSTLIANQHLGITRACTCWTPMGGPPLTRQANGPVLLIEQRQDDIETPKNAMSELELVSEHVDTPDSKYELAVTLHDQQKYVEAEQLLRQPVQQQEKVLGGYHKDTHASKELLQEVLLAKVPSAPTNALAESVLSRLSEFFADGDQQAAYTYSEIQQVSLLLSQVNLQWSKVPRTYMILQIIDCLDLLNSFINLGISDYWFPFTEQSLPPCLQPGKRSQFVGAQNLVMTKSMDLEKDEGGQHCYFRQDEPLPLEIKGILGLGRFGQVDRVLSTTSFREYALKRVPRSAVFSGRTKEDSRRKAEYVNQFIAEIGALKRLKHRHVVEFVGSYTDPKYIGLIMSPVADMDLLTYLAGTNTARYQELRTFFGCLARALAFLHEQSIRHNDIKPTNILVHGGNILFIGFELVFDFTDKTDSTTTGMVNGMTPKYCAPEVVNYEPQNTLSDIWSLGVVFLEMTAVLKGRTVAYMYDFLEEHGSGRAYVRTNPTGTDALITELKETGSPTDNAALVWVQDMIMLPQQLRPTAASLLASIASAGQKGDGNEAFCGICCVSPDDFLSEFDELEIADA